MEHWSPFRRARSCAMRLQTALVLTAETQIDRAGEVEAVDRRSVSRCWPLLAGDVITARPECQSAGP